MRAGLDVPLPIVVRVEPTARCFVMDGNVKIAYAVLMLPGTRYPAEPIRTPVGRKLGHS